MKRKQLNIKQKEEVVLSKFLPMEQLSCRSPTTRNNLCVFWSKEEEAAATSSVLSIQNQIRTFLCSFDLSLSDDVLIQFWAPTTTTMVGLGGRPRRLLTISQQPFAFTNIYDDRKHDIYENLIRYRKHFADCPFEDGDGVIGRVFHNELPELSPYAWHYAPRDHPHINIALSCGISQIWAFPVFQPSHQSLHCVGVLEFLFQKNMFFSINCFDILCNSLEGAGLVTIHSYTQVIRKQIQKGIINHVAVAPAVADEIKDALRQVREAYGLCPASAWVRFKHTTFWNHGSNPNSSYVDSNASGMGDYVVYIPGLYNIDDSIELPYYLALHHLIMRVGQGLIGNAFLSNNPYLCKDVTQLNMSQYPMALVARCLKFTACFTICLQSIATGDRDYVLEFYLSRDMAHSNDLHNLIFSMLATLKHHLKSFEAVVGDPGDELFVEVDKFSIDNVFESLKTRSTTVNETDPQTLHNEGEVLQANFPGQHLATEELANSGGIEGDSVGLGQRRKAIVPENNCL